MPKNLVSCVSDSAIAPVSGSARLSIIVPRRKRLRCLSRSFGCSSSSGRETSLRRSAGLTGVRGLLGLIGLLGMGSSRPSLRLEPTPSVYVALITALLLQAEDVLRRAFLIEAAMLGDDL